jgi:single-strand DNA-binding protein
MLNRVVLIGRLTRDPEMKYTPAGVPVAQLGIAVQRVTKNETGDYDVDFFNVVAWRRTAEFAANYLTKGRLVSIDGRLRTRSWVDQASGQKRSVVEIEAENIDGLERRETTEGAPEAESGSDSAAPARAPVPAAAASGGSRNTRNTPAAPDDDLDESDPFADE